MKKTDTTIDLVNKCKIRSVKKLGMMRQESDSESVTDLQRNWYAQRPKR